MFDTLRIVASRIRGLLKRRTLEQDFERELDAHLWMLAEENMRSGMTPDEARRSARMQLGGIEQLRESHRELWGLPRLDSIAQDIRYAIRMLRKNPGFTAIAVFALAIGIAANTAVFTAFNAAALRTIQAKDPGRIVAVYRSTLGEEDGQAFNYQDYLDYRNQNRVFSDLFAASGTEVSLNATASSGARPQASGGITAAIGFRFFQQMAGTAELGRAALVSENYFAALGISPLIGRGFTASEPYPVVMLSENFWARKFRSDPSLLGKVLRLNGKPFTVIGITPRDFIGTYQNAPSVWLPISAYPLLEPSRDPLHNADDDCCEIFGRLKPGVTQHEAQADLTVLAEQLRRSYPPGGQNSKPVTISVGAPGPMGVRLNPQAITVVLAVMCAVALVLLIACANVAGLQLARSAARRREIGVRLALGASRGRLIQQLLTEAAILAILAGGAGLLASSLAERLLVTSVAAALPPEWGFLAIDVNPDLRVFVYTLAVSLFAGILFGLTPALEASKPSVISVVTDESPGFAGKLRGRRLRHFFVGAQVAACSVLLIVSGLLARGSAHAVRLNPGFETKRVLGLDIEFPPGLGYDAAKSGDIVRRMVERFRLAPGVKEVAEGRVPLGGGLRMASAALDAPAGQDNGPAPVFYYGYVTPNYFETLSIPIIRGRAFTEAEARAGAPVAVISEAAARAIWPGRDPIGQRVTLDASKQFHVADEPFPTAQRVEVIGVSKDMRSAWLNEVDSGLFSLPLPAARYGDVMIRTDGDPNSLAAMLGTDVKAVDPNVIVYAESLDGLMTMNPGFVFSRVGAVLSTIIGLLGLLLASVGVYGMVSYAVVQRTHEVGVRMALGACRTDVLRLIIQQGVRPVVAGVLVGVLISAAVSRLLTSLLFGISSLDPLAFAGVSVFLMAVALVACYLPARRASRVDPMVALRYE